MKVATAFSGGFGTVEFALKYLDIKHEVVFACEWMKPQRESYINNHGEPTSNFYEDINDLDGTKYKGEIDYYHLSPPCQEYSMAGNRGGAATEKGGLMFQAIKSIDEVQPKMFSVENVKGLLSSNGGEDWKNIIRDFKSLKGYTISWGIMNAKEQGTPQNRERVFIVGFRGQAHRMSFPPRVELKKVLRDVLEDEVDEKYYLSDKMIKSFIKKDEETSFKFNPHTKDSLTSNCITARYYKMAVGDPYIKEPLLNQVGNIDQQGHNSLWGRVYDTNGIAPTQNAKGGGAGAKTGLFKVDKIGEINPSQSGAVYSIDGVATCINANGGGQGAKTGLYKVKSATKQGYETATENDSINLSFPDSKTRRGRVGKGVAQTLDTNCNQGIINEFRIRRLTPRECARVQGDFEDKFKIDGFSDTKLYEFIGNAMDISTTKNLITQMIKHSETVEFTKPNEPSFKSKQITQGELF